MRIQTNMAAINAYNNVKKNNKKVTDSIERLSSGKQINKAADDAAGMAISQKMEAQTNGLRQAKNNIMNGKSLLQTAEGGLKEIQSLIQRMRELSVQAANETLNSEDRQSIQREIDQLKGEIDNIANNTEFGSSKLKLLRPPTIEETSGNKTGKVDIVFVVDNTTSMDTIQDKVKNNLTDFIDNIKNEGVNDIWIGVMEYNSNSTVKSFSGSNWTSDEEKAKDKIANLGSSSDGGTENTMQAIEDTISNYNFRSNEDSTQVKHAILVTNEDSDDEVNLDSTINKANTEGLQIHGVYPKPKDDFGDSTSEFDNLTSNTEGKSVDLDDSSWGTKLANKIGGAIGSSAGSSTKEKTVKPLKLQVGPNQGDILEIKLTDARTKSLGVDNIKIDPPEKAQKAIGKLDEVINKTSSTRSRFGAYQNRLDHIQSNVSNYNTNLSQANSRLKDANMAKQQMKLTKNQILQKAAQSILAQTNQLPQGALKLLPSKMKS
ncbi:H48 family flagellin FliC [Halanaerocella petrolearia]